MNAIIAHVGSYALNALQRLSRTYQFTKHSLAGSYGTTKKAEMATLIHMERVGIDSLLITCSTGFFSGAVLTLQAYHGFVKLGTTSMIGPVVATTMIRELGPILTGIMVVGRAGSAMTAELASMAINEQIDALKTLGVDPIAYLVSPRVIASICMLPILGFFTMLAGIIGGYLIVDHQLHLNGAQYISLICETTTLYEIIIGLFKTAFFGLLISIIASYNGIYATGSTLDVARATTTTVATAALLIFATNFLLSAIFFHA